MSDLVYTNERHRQDVFMRDLWNQTRSIVDSRQLVDVKVGRRADACTDCKDRSALSSNGGLETTQGIAGRE